MKLARYVAVGALFPFLAAAAQDSSKPATRFDAVVDVVAKNYRESLPREALEERALRAFLKDLDPYSNYMNAAEWADFQGRLRARFGGVGVNLRINPETRLPEIAQLMIDSPAGESGVRRGDSVLKIDGRSLEGLTIDDVIPLFRGAVGTVAELIVRHAGSTSSEAIHVTRRSIRSPSVRGVRRNAAGEPLYLMDEEKGIGYIRVMNLADDTVPELEKALVALNRHGMKGLIFDLRDSSGGKLSAAVGAADLFLDGGRIVSVASRRDGDEVYDADAGALTSVPMVMLINEWTVSSSEVLAGALTDNFRAITMGHRTYGKGRVQVTFTLAEGLGGVVLTTGTFQRPSGKTIDQHDAGVAKGQAGIAPDPGMEIELDAKESEAWSEEAGRLDGATVLTMEEQKFGVPDRVLDCALEVLDAAIRQAESVAAVDR
jgi:carboxyl-terminal processing protease